MAKLEKFGNTMDQQFEQIAGEYDDDEIGELDEEDPSVKGVMDLSQLDYILDEFLEENSRTKLQKGERLVPKSIAADVPRDYEAVDLEEDDEEDTLAGYEYLSCYNEVQEEQWDCESILSQ